MRARPAKGEHFEDVVVGCDLGVKRAAALADTKPGVDIVVVKKGEGGGTEEGGLGEREKCAAVQEWLGSESDGLRRVTA